MATNYGHRVNRPLDYVWNALGIKMPRQVGILSEEIRPIVNVVPSIDLCGELANRGLHAWSQQINSDGVTPSGTLMTWVPGPPPATNLGPFDPGTWVIQVGACGLNALGSAFVPMIFQVNHVGPSGLVPFNNMVQVCSSTQGTVWSPPFALHFSMNERLTWLNTSPVVELNGKIVWQVIARRLTDKRFN